MCVVCVCRVCVSCVCRMWEYARGRVRWRWSRGQATSIGVLNVRATRVGSETVSTCLSELGVGVCEGCLGCASACVCWVFLCVSVCLLGVCVSVGRNYCVCARDASPLNVGLREGARAYRQLWHLRRCARRHCALCALPRLLLCHPPPPRLALLLRLRLRLLRRA